VHHDKIVFIPRRELVEDDVQQGFAAAQRAEERNLDDARPRNTGFWVAASATRFKFRR